MHTFCDGTGSCTTNCEVCVEPTAAWMPWLLGRLWVFSSTYCCIGRRVAKFNSGCRGARQPAYHTPTHTQHCSPAGTAPSTPCCLPPRQAQLPSRHQGEARAQGLGCSAAAGGARTCAKHTSRQHNGCSAQQVTTSKRQTTAWLLPKHRRDCWRTSSQSVLCMSKHAWQQPTPPLSTEQ